MSIFVHYANGGNDHYTLLGPLVLELLRGYYRQIRPKGIHIP